jgi:predicted ferric reductase
MALHGARRPTTSTGPIVITRTDAKIVDRRRARFSRSRELRADLLVGAFWTSVAASAALWVASGGPRRVPDAGGAVIAAGILCGLVATDLVLVMLVLAARVPLLDRTFGQDRMIAFHRRLGKPAFLLLVAHAVLLVLGYAMVEPAWPLVEAVRLATASPAMTAAFVSLGLFALVVGTSVVLAIRRRFAYEAWHAVHLLSYAAVLTALPHQITNGAVLAYGTVERVWWAGLYCTAFGAVVLFRVVLPLVRSVRHGLRVGWIEPVGPDAVSIHMVGRDLDRLDAVGGQYATWRFWTWRTWWHGHPISFSAVPTDGSVRITVRTLGAGTKRLARLRPGTFVSMEGPYGVFTDRSRRTPNLAIVAAGIGITGARSLLEDSSLRPGEATVLLRASDERQRYLWQEVIGLIRERNGTLLTMTGNRPKGVATWMSASAAASGMSLARVFPRLADSDLYVCGAPAWSDLVIAEARALGVPREQIHVERFES